ncbi:MAG: ComEC/Rec2 family competence protein [Actinobacteria bacterium]|nr:ComEC/Rec2 family competence protein [Actinomycetota bacterium]
MSANGPLVSQFGQGLSAWQAIACAGATIVGAAVSWPISSLALLAAVGLGSTAGFVVVFSTTSRTASSGPWMRRGGTATLVVALFLVATSLASSSLSGLRPPESHDVDAIVDLVADPEARGSGQVVDVRLNGARYEAWFFGPSRGAVERLLSGESIHVRGRVEPFARPWNGHRPRHVVARLNVDWAWGRDEAGGLTQSTNQFRRHLVAGAGSLSATQRALFLGFIVGDDRDLPFPVVEEFRAAGLSHLTAVSGQNVVFVLGLIAPVVAGFGRTSRWLVLVAVLLWFGTLTRWEPSVMRAIATAGTALTVSPDRHSRPQFQVLGVAVTMLVLVDPMLVWSVGFRLSVAATVGIVLFARSIERSLRGPRFLRRAAAVTIAAQMGVAPVQLTTFGPLPIASLPANLAAGLATAPLMVWGLAAGVVGGFVPPRWAALLHIPTKLLTSWVAWVAHTASSWSLPRAGWLAWFGGLAVCLFLVNAQRHADRLGAVSEADRAPVGGAR